MEDAEQGQGHGVSPSMIEKGATYRADIDGLRAIAIIAVIVNHTDAKLLPSGFLGVDLFFVISGFVISASLYQRNGACIKSFLLAFYARRVKRLLPALICCVLITSIAISLFNPDPSFSLETGLASLFGISNVYLLKTASNYFGESAALNAFTHTWSLCVEEQYYVVYPVFFYFYASKPFRFRTIIALVSFISVAAFVTLIVLWKDFAFYMMPTRFWEFGVGVLSFSLNKVIWRSRFDWLIASIALLCFPAIFAAPERYEQYSTITIVIVAAVVITKIQTGSLSYRVLTTQTSLFLGRISYSLYLWHWSVLSIGKWTIGVKFHSYPYLLFAMLTLGWASYRFIEKPLRYGKWPTSSFGTLMVAIFATCASAIVVLSLMKPFRGKFFLAKMPALEAHGVATLTDPYTLPDGSRWNGIDCVLSDNKQVGKQIPVKDCTLGNPLKAQHRILVIGNSFSAAMVHAFDPLVLNEQYAVTITSSWGASVVPEIENKGMYELANNYYWNDVIPRHISNLRQGDWVLMINDMAMFSPEEQSSGSNEQLNLLEKGLSNLADKLRPQGVSLAIMHGNPFAREAKCDPTQAISQWYAPMSTRCKFLSKEETIIRRIPLSRILERVRSTKGIKIIDLLPIFCPAETCTYENTQGIVLYRDEYSHPSIEAARLSSPFIISVLKSDKD